MPDHRKHRGQNPEDSKLFQKNNLTVLLEAVKDLSFLLKRHYNMNSALKVVGDRYSLNARQRITIARSSCSDEAMITRKRKEVFPDFIRKNTILIDGYNILITIESALSGGILFKSRDGCYRDISSIHGTYKKVEETIPALVLIGNNLQKIEPEKVVWYLDSPVSNSGRLKQLIDRVALENGWQWNVELVHNPDTCLKNRKDVIATSDALILNEVNYWLNLTKIIIEKDIKACRVIDFTF
ncbi:MAG TPA: DUF434 domain-containing protein [Cytophagales bacterium]|nr:DUF434 domain-containing protein [Cytophagales bacterium]